MTISRHRTLLLACALLACHTAAFAQAFPLQTVSPPEDDAGLNALAVDPMGNAVAVWSLSGSTGTGVGLRAARYVAATNTWSPAVDLIRSSEPRHFIRDLAMDSTGNAIAVGVRSHNQGSGISPGEIVSTRYSAATGQWTPLTVLSPFVVEGLSSPQVVIDAEGNGTAVWLQGTCFRCIAGSTYAARYSPASGWSTAQVIAERSDGLRFSPSFSPLLALDGNGNVTVTFARHSATGELASIHAVRYAKSTGTWEAEQLLATPTCTRCFDARLAMDPQGNALLSWQDDAFGALEGVRFNVATGARSSVEQITPNGQDHDVAVDAAGNFVAIWAKDARSSVLPHLIQTRRYSSATGSWGAIGTLANSGGSPRVVMDANGHATAGWGAFNGSVNIVQGARFDAAAGAWSGAIVLSGPINSYTPQLAVDAAGDVMFGWTADPYYPSPGNSFVQSTRWPAGVMPAGPGAPTDLSATVSGNTITLNWSPPTVGGAPSSYTLVARLAPGGTVLATVPMGAGTSFSVTAPNGTFVLSVVAANAAGTGPESASVTVTVPQAGSPPGAPRNLAASVTAATVSFAWNPPSSGGAVTSYVLIAGLTPGFTVPFATLPLGATPGFLATGVPAGTYYARVVAQNASGTSTPSNEVVFTVAGIAPPGAPTLHAPTASGSTVNLSWSAGSGGTPTGYTLTASVTPGAEPIVSVPLTGTSVSFSSVPPGTYYLRLTASNSAGTSPPSAEVVVQTPPSLLATSVPDGVTP